MSSYLLIVEVIVYLHIFQWSNYSCYIEAKMLHSRFRYSRVDYGILNVTKIRRHGPSVAVSLSRNSTTSIERAPAAVELSLVSLGLYNVFNGFILILIHSSSKNYVMIELAMLSYIKWMGGGSCLFLFLYSTWTFFFLVYLNTLYFSKEF